MGNEKNSLFIFVLIENNIYLWGVNEIDMKINEH